MSEERKATDILLSIENRMNEFGARLSNLDNNIKILLQKHNQQSTAYAAKAPLQAAPMEQAPDVPQNSFEHIPKTNAFDRLKQRAGVDQDIDPTVSDDDLLSVDASPEFGSLRNNRFASGPIRKVAVSQEIFDSSGNPYIIVPVVVRNQQGEVVARVRTNGKGKWMAPLEPGRYFVEINKKPNKEKREPGINKKFDLTVPESTVPIDLQPITSSK